MTELIHSISGYTEQVTVKDSLSFPLAVESAFGSVFVGVSGDVVRSVEGDSKNWTTESAGLTGKVTALKLHTDGFLYLGTDGGRLYRKNSVDGAWSQVGSAQSTIFHQIASKSGDNIYIAGEDGDVYTSDGSTLTSEHTTGETSVKGVEVWDGKIYASTTAAKVFAKDSSWWQQDILSGDSIGYIWRLLEVDGQLTGIADNGFHYRHDGFTWEKNKISDGLMQAHAVYLDREVASNSSGDLFFRENQRWNKKHTFPTIVGMGSHKGRLITVVSGDDVVKSINFPKLINNGNDNWSESEPNKLGFLGNVKRDGAISEQRSYKDVSQTNISGTVTVDTLALAQTQLQLIQQATERKEFKLWFDEDKYKFGMKNNFQISPIKENIQPYTLSIVHNDPYRYANQFKFSHLELAWSDDKIGISQASGDADVDFGTNSKHSVRQTFIAEHSTVSKITIKTAANTGTPSGDVVCTIRDEFSNVQDTVTVVSGDWVAESELELSFQYAPIQIGRTYNLMLSGDQAFDDTNFRSVSGATLSNEYQGGQYEHSSGDTFTQNISGDLYFKISYCTKSITVNNSGNAFARPRITMIADSGDLIDTRIINTEPEGGTSFFRYSKNLVQTGSMIFDSTARQILGGGNDAANFFTGDFIEMPKGDNVVTIESAPARYQIEHRDTFI
jgi:hypothetical protein